MLRPTDRTSVSPVFVLLVAITVGGGVLCTLDSELALTAGTVVLVLGGWAVSLCLHEFGHAAVAYRGGDTSVDNRGYLSLDIRRYLNPALSFVLPLFFLLLGGIPLPGGAVWINDHAIRSKLVRSLVSLAGPLINLALGIALIAATLAVEMPAGLMAALSFLALVQVLAFLLNILPVPGLDGFGVLEPYLSRQGQDFADKIKPYGPLAFFVLLIGLPALSTMFFAIGSGLFLLFGGSGSAATLGNSVFMFWRH